MDRGMNCYDALTSAGPRPSAPHPHDNADNRSGYGAYGAGNERRLRNDAGACHCGYLRLTLSTVVTLIFIPVLYMWMNERKRKSNARKTAKQIAKNAKLHAEELARERAAQNNAKPV